MDPPTVSLSELTSTELADLQESGVDTAIVPVAAVEQHGPHLPLGTDAIVGEALGERLARELGDAVVVPVVSPGVSLSHRSFAGTLSVPPEVLMDTLRGTVRSLVDGGFEHVALLPTHGGNFPAANAVAPDLATEFDDASVFVVGDLRRYMDLLNEGFAAAEANEAGGTGEAVAEPVVHAGATETSLVLAIDADAVREDALTEGYEGPLSAATLFREGIDHYDADGVLGDATRASAEAGERILDRLVGAYVAEIDRERGDHAGGS